MIRTSNARVTNYSIRKTSIPATSWVSFPRGSWMLFLRWVVYALTPHPYSTSCNLNACSIIAITSSSISKLFRPTSTSPLPHLHTSSKIKDSGIQLFKEYTIKSFWVLVVFDGQIVQNDRRFVIPVFEVANVLFKEFVGISQTARRRT